MDIAKIKEGKEVIWISVNKLTVSHLYQRRFEDKRSSKIQETMKETGFWTHCPIVLNQKKQVVDGQHRLDAALKLGLKEVPCVIVHFPTPEVEAAFYYYINDWDITPKPIDYWHARYMAGDVIAQTIYTLNNDVTSHLHDRIKLRGVESNGARFNVTDVLLFVNGAVRGRDKPWHRRDDGLMSAFLKEKEYGTIRSEVNIFLQFFYDFAGKNRTQNPIAYYSSSLKAILGFYLALEKQGFLDHGHAEIMKKMRTFEFKGPFAGAVPAEKKDMLRRHFNSGKRQKKLLDN